MGDEPPLGSEEMRRSYMAAAIAPSLPALGLIIGFIGLVFGAIGLITLWRRPARPDPAPCGTR